MNTLHIHQSQASKAMIIIGATELASRAFISYFGNHIKGYMLHVYFVICIIMTVVNILGYMATTFVQLIIYGIGM